MSKDQFRPQLACDVDDNKLTFPLKWQLKVDGVRLLVKNSIATGRSMKKYKNKKLTNYFSDPKFEGFDMEIITTYHNDPDLCRLTTSQVNTIEGGLPNAALVFDYLTEETINLPYSERMDKLRHYITKGMLPDEVKLIVSSEFVVNNIDELNVVYTNALDNNFEGIIIRSGKGMHKNGRCTVNEGSYLRKKPTGDSEGVVLRLEEAYENQNEAKVNELGHTERSTHKANMVPKGMIGALWLRDIHSGEEVKVGAGKLTHEERILYFQQPELILGELVKYAFLATGKKDLPRHPRYISRRAWEDISK